MGRINIPRSERDALKAVDADILEQLIEQCVLEECPSGLQRLHLESCGQYVASELRTFKRALTEHGNAKSAKKREETDYSVRSAGDDLAHAVWQMKHRLETEETEAQLFLVDDQIIQPVHFSERLTVRVDYRWRRAIDDEWIYDSITFSHTAEIRPDYAIPPTKRKASAANREQERQRKLSAQWQHLMSLGLQAVRDYFREGRDGVAIPATFQAKADRELNNFSAQFWLARP